MNLLNNILAGIISAVIIFIIKWFFEKLYVLIRRRDPRFHPLFLFVSLFVVWFIINYISAFHIFPISEAKSIPFLISVFSFSSLAYIFFLLFELNKFWSVGIRGVDKNINLGINYKKSLELCQNKIMFLGIGAGKLSKDKEFINALNRCKQTPIKFLLCNPENKALISAAKSSCKPDDEYKNIVLNSLRVIAELKDRRDLNIEVRLYLGEPIVRMMFIDDSICLFSYNALGEGDGSQLPQLHIVKNHSHRDVESFYYFLEKYFNNLWESSNPWNYKLYL
jgi:hypothetical protein